MIMQKVLPLLHRRQQDDYNHVQLNFMKILFAFQIQQKFQ